MVPNGLVKQQGANSVDHEKAYDTSKSKPMTANQPLISACGRKPTSSPTSTLEATLTRQRTATDKMALPSIRIS
jgi:hypothetical protein